VRQDVRSPARVIRGLRRGRARDEVEAGLGPQGTFVRGPIHLFARGTEVDDRHAFVVEDGAYLSARWPGDAYLLGKRLAARFDAVDRARRGSAPQTRRSTPASRQCVRTGGRAAERASLRVTTVISPSS
jgi:hypothetical protein